MSADVLVAVGNASGMGFVRLQGELTSSTIERVSAAVDGVCADVPELVVVDLSGVEDIDDAGYDYLLRLRAGVTAMGARLYLVSGPATLSESFSIVQLHDEGA